MIKMNGEFGAQCDAVFNVWDFRYCVENIDLIHCVCVGVSLGIQWFIGLCIRLINSTHIKYTQCYTHLKLRGEEATRKAVERAFRRC